MGGLFDFSGGDDNKNVMQDFTGYTEEAATSALTGMGLEVGTPKYEDNEEIAGTVIDQSIKEGKKFKKGDKITLTVSNGPAAQSSDNGGYVEVPTLTDKTYDNAKQILEDLGLKIKRGEDAYSEDDIGIVVTQNPMKGAKVKEGDTITVSVSKGPEPSPSPADHTISVTAGKGGSITPKGAVTVADGEDITFTITPDTGYEIFEVKVDGTSIGAVTSYPFTKVTDDHTIYAVFRKSTASPSPSPTTSTNPVSNTDIG